MKVYLIVGMSSTQYIVEADDDQPAPKAGDRYVARAWGHLLSRGAPAVGPACSRGAAWQGATRAHCRRAC